MARVARAHGVNANQVFSWRGMYRQGRLGNTRQRPIPLLPVTVTENQVVEAGEVVSQVCREPVISAAAASSTWSFPKHIFASRATPIRPWCACCWSACSDDYSSSWVTHLDRGGSNGYAARVHRPECMVQTVLSENPFSGHLFVFRGRRGDLIKVLWFDGDGFCLFAKRLERGRFVWPKADSGTVSLTRAQLSMLLEGIDWRRPVRTASPQLAI